MRGGLAARLHSFYHQSLPVIIGLLLLGWWACSEWFTIYPPVGVYIALLAFLAAVVTVKPPEHPWGKVVWIGVFGLVLYLEIHNLYKDRASHDAQVERDRKEARESFQKIATGIDATIKQAGEQFTATMKRSDQIFQTAREGIDSATGGSSLCYFVFSNPMDDASSNGFAVVQVGDYPLYDLNMRIVDLRAFAKNPVPKSQTMDEWINALGGKFDIGALAVKSSWVKVAQIKLGSPSERDFSIFFGARNGFWDEALRLRKKDGKWYEALKVWRGPTGNRKRKPAFENFDKGFPKEAVTNWTK